MVHAPYTIADQKANFFQWVLSNPKLRQAIADAAWKIEVVKKPKDRKGFEVLPGRWVVERTIAWINRRRRLS